MHSDSFFGPASKIMKLMRCRLQKGPAGEQFRAFVLFEKSLINWTFL